MIRPLRFGSLGIVSFLMCVGYIGALFPATLVRAEEVRCQEVAVSVFAVLPQDASSACKVANDAIRFFQKVGLKTGGAIRVEMVPGSNNDLLPQTYGCYDAALDVVRLWDYETCRQHSKNRRHFGQRMTRAMYESFIAHEISHAIAVTNFETPTQSRLAHEYIAYVTQFVTMDTDLRDSILHHYSHISVSNMRDLSYASWIMSPEIFAVRCYKHFLKPENGPEFIRSLLSGSRQLYQLESPF